MDDADEPVTDHGGHVPDESDLLDDLSAEASGDMRKLYARQAKLLRELRAHVADDDARTAAIKSELERLTALEGRVSQLERGR